MRLLGEQYTKMPYYEIRRMTAWLHALGYEVNHKQVSRLLRLMGLHAIYPKPHLSQVGPQHTVYPYPLSRLRSSDRTRCVART
jgi:putative transposase